MPNEGAGRASEAASPSEPISVTGTPRSVSLSRLRQLDIPVDVAGLSAALRTEHLAVRVEAAFLLGSGLPSGGPDAAAGLRAALSDENARVRVEAAFWLALAEQERDARDLLVAELHGIPFADAPMRAAVALARLGDPSGYPVVIDQLSSPLPSNRFEAVAALAYFREHQGKTVDSIVLELDALLERAALDPEELIRDEAVRVRALLPQS